MTASAFSFSDQASRPAVIACLGTTSNAQDVAAIAAQYARLLDRPLILFHSIEFERSQARLPDPLEWHLRRGRALRRLKEARDRLDGAVPESFSDIDEGNWIETLSNRLQSALDPVIVMGTSRHGNTGHHVSTLLQNGAGKVLVVPSGFRASSEFSQIAIPLDGSLFSEAALAQAIAFAKAHDSELLLVHAVPPPGIDAFGLPAESDLNLQIVIERRNELAACNFLERNLQRLRNLGIKARSRCLKGDPRSCLAGLLEAEPPALVVLSARGQGIRNCEDLALGSTASYLLDHLNLPVMVVGSTIRENGKASLQRHMRHSAALRVPLNNSPVAA